MIYILNEIGEIDEIDEIIVSKTLDTTGKLCPGLISDIDHSINKLKYGQVLEVLSTDSATCRSIPDWCDVTGNIILSSTFNMKNYKYYYWVKRVRKKW